MGDIAVPVVIRLRNPNASGNNNVPIEQQEDVNDNQDNNTNVIPQQEYRRQGSKVYEIDDYLYHKNSTSSKCYYLRCALYKSNHCSATAKYDRIENIILGHQRDKHSHNSSAYRKDIHDLKMAVRKNAAEDMRRPMVEIFRTAVNSTPIAGELSYRELQQGMYKSRYQKMPPNPSSAEEFLMIATSRPVTELYAAYMENIQAIINVERVQAVIMFTDKVKGMLSKCKVSYDGTFYVSAKNWYQLWIIHVRYRSTYLPSIYVLMKEKTREAYEAVLNKIKELVPSFDIEEAIGDFEFAAKQAIESSFPDSNVKGCLFHHNNAVWKRISKKGLSGEYHKNKSFKEWVQRLFCLPFLPSDKIQNEYNDLSNEEIVFASSDLKNKFIAFKSYYNRFWIEKVTPAWLSVFSSTSSTNNHS